MENNFEKVKLSNIINEKGDTIAITCGKSDLSLYVLIRVKENNERYPQIIYLNAFDFINLFDVVNYFYNHLKQRDVEEFLDSRDGTLRLRININEFSVVLLKNDINLSEFSVSLAIMETILRMIEIDDVFNKLRYHPNYINYVEIDDI